MCGINGVIGNHVGADQAQIIAKMNDCIAHRGPDSSGRWHNETCGLGHRRLSIDDYIRSR